MSARRTALIIAACYALPAGYVLASTWYRTKPLYHGMDWIGIDLLTYPSCGVLYLFPYGDKAPNSVAALIGLILNSTAIYTVVWLYKRWAEKMDKLISAKARNQV